MVRSLPASLLRCWLGLGLVVAADGCNEAKPQVQSRVRVQAGPPIVRDLDVTLRYPVEVEADESVAVAPVAISGFLRRVLVDVGDKVKGGQLIAVIDCREYSAQRTQAETTIAKWEAQVDETRARYERMLKMGEKVVAPAEIDVARKEVRVAEAELAEAEAKLSEAGQRQGYCSLTAPFSGYVTDRYLDVGAMVGPGGPAVVNIVKTREVRVVAFVVENDAPKVVKGAKVGVVLHAYPDTTFEAEVTRIGRSLDAATRTLRVEMDIPNIEDQLLPAMTGTASIVVGKREKALLVPNTAVLQLEDVAYVYLARADGAQLKAERVEVETGIDLGDWIEISEGVSTEDQVIVVGRELVDDGTPIEVVEPESGTSLFAGPVDGLSPDSPKAPQAEGAGTGDESDDSSDASDSGKAASTGAKGDDNESSGSGDKARAQAKSAKHEAEPDRDASKGKPEPRPGKGKGEDNGEAKAKDEAKAKNEGKADASRKKGSSGNEQAGKSPKTRSGSKSSSATDDPATKKRAPPSGQDKGDPDGA